MLVQYFIYLSTVVVEYVAYFTNITTCIKVICLPAYLIPGFLLVAPLTLDYVNWICSRA